MSYLLIEDRQIPVSPKLACAVGLNEAIVLQQIHYWTEHNRNQNRNLVDGQYWVFNSYSKWKEQFPWWSERTIQRILSGLEEKGLIVSGQYNKHKRDRTKWYHINYEALNCLLKSGQYGTIQNDNLTSPLPESTREQINTEREEIGKGQFEELPAPIYISQDVTESTGNALRQDSIFSTVTKQFGFERAKYMLSVVDWYIDKGYPHYVGRCHPEENKAKRMTFAQKLLECSDCTVEDDCLIVAALQRALQEYTDCDPTIYYITSPKVLGYWLIKDDEVGYESIIGTKYAPAEAMY